MERNYRGKIGEIDLVMLLKDKLVFVEVKTRMDSDRARGMIFDSVNPEQETAIKHTAREYVRKKLSRKFRDNYRIDFVGVILKEMKVVDIQHLIAAI